MQWLSSRSLSCGRADRAASNQGGATGSLEVLADDQDSAAGEMHLHRAARTLIEIDRVGETSPQRGLADHKMRIGPLEIERDPRRAI
jgi:hypothetical protein